MGRFQDLGDPIVSAPQIKCRVWTYRQRVTKNCNTLMEKGKVAINYPQHSQKKGDTSLNLTIYLD